MRKFITLVGLAAAAIVVLAQGRGVDLLGSFAKALNSAQSLSVNYTVMPVGGAPETVVLELGKPNLAKIDLANESIVADGKTITTYDKKAKTYFKQPQTSDALAQVFARHDLNLWAAFFDANAFKNVSRVTAQGTKNRKGMALEVVDVVVDPAGAKQVTMYLNQQDKVARQAEIVLKGHGDQETLIVDTKSLNLGGAPDAKNFEFKAPEGSREMTQEELNSAKWYTDLEEAKEVAAKTKRLLLVDFYADW